MKSAHKLPLQKYLLPLRCFFSELSEDQQLKRSHLYELFKTLKTGRKVTFWYGGRSRAELFYIHYFRDLERDFPNFKFHLVLSDALPEDNWVEKKNLDDPDGDGFTGFVHQVVIDKFLSNHETPEDIELYFCGPPLMNQAVIKMAEDWGIPDENVRWDDFGGQIITL